MALRLYFKLDELGAQLKPALHPEASDRYAVAEDHEVGYLVNQGIVSKSWEDCHHLVGYITSAPPSGIGARCEMAKDSRSHPNRNEKAAACDALMPGANRSDWRTCFQAAALR
jgi:hypothetical protein